MTCKDWPWIESESAAAEFMATASESDLVVAMDHIDRMADNLGRFHKPTQRRLKALSHTIYEKGCERFGEFFAMPF